MTTLNEKQIKFFEDLQVNMQKGAVQPEELAKLIKAVLGLVNSLKQQLEQSIQTTDTKLRLDINTALDEIKALETRMSSALGSVSSKAQQLTLSEVSKMMIKFQKEMESMRGDMPEMPDLSSLDNRITSLENEEIEIPTIDEIEKDLPKLGLSVRDSLELIQEEKEKLKIEAIGYLRKELDELKDLIKSKSTSTGSVGGNRVTSIANLIIPVSGTINDSNVTFTSYKEPNYLIINGAAYQKTGGAITWSWVSGTITLSNAVGTNGSIWGIK